MYSISITNYNELNILKTNECTRLQCPRCFNKWDYKGRNIFYATCSYCRTTVNIRKNKSQIDSLVDASNQSVQTAKGD
jgi:hypothetical protein